MARETRDLFTAIFESYEKEPVKAINLKEIRTRFGGEVKQNLTFEEEKVENFPPSLSDGDFASFVADLQFERVKFIDMFQVR